jgi:tetratricopeptide (TPR) repeat protein
MWERFVCLAALAVAVDGLATNLSPFPSRSKTALEDLQAVVVADNTNAAAHKALGLAARRARNLGLAADSLERAVALQPDDDEAKKELGSLLAEMGYVPEAEAILRDLLSREPQSQQSTSTTRLRLAALMLAGQGQRQEAYDVYSRVCALRPSPVALLAGVAADSMGNHSTAMRFYKDAWELDPYDEDAVLHLMIAHLRNGDEASAAALRPRLPDHVLSSVDYALSTSVAMDPSMHYYEHDLLQLALTKAARSPALDGGLVLEFGVYHGKTIRMIGSHFSNGPVHGFDTFSGLPEDWYSTGAGAYSTYGALPKAPGNVQFHVGLFSETLPGFLEAHPDVPIRFMNIDCDLYSSTKDVFDAVAHRVRPGTVIVFDEYTMNPHWAEDEYRAFQEAVAEHGWTYEYLAISLVSYQAAVRITEVVGGQQPGTSVGR